MSTTEKALAWWNPLHILVKMKHAQNYFTRDDAINLTDRQIEVIWRKECGQIENEIFNHHELPDDLEELYSKPNQKQYSQEEVDRLLDQQAARTTAQVLKNNQKQFKKFNESLFRNNIDKFSDEDKLKAIEILLKSSDFRFEVSGTAQDGGKYSEFDITKIKVIKSNLDYEGMNSLSGKVFESTFCIVKP